MFLSLLRPVLSCMSYSVSRERPRPPYSLLRRACFRLGPHPDPRASSGAPHPCLPPPACRRSAVYSAEGRLCPVILPVWSSVYLFPCQKHGMKRSPVCTNPTVFPVANSHFLSSIQGIVAQMAGGDRQTLDSMMGKEFPMASFTLYSLTWFLGASPQFCKAEFLLASSKVLNNISGF